ncbi:translation elongation factor Ts [Pseudobdellovibrio exovorus]|uniref:Elongation factor Ts n=1 Tax=Pseudobdellovibrio exovorus JSS TaxID=1184267 RepID=M4V7E3_9BACT|nr:translation elongation factor Ts [Pseudobdellovibrio exovorus]AGH94355.1 elongation factor Ts [Pseudobdellovibrio exovorus JSS]
MSISASMVKELREKTSAGMMDCKKALEESKGDFEAAVEWLRVKGLSAAAKKADRVAAEGLVNAATDGKVAVVVEINSETDFVSRNDGFKAFVNTITQHALKSTSTAPILEQEISAGKTVGDSLKEAIATIGENLVIRRTEKYTVTGEGLVHTYIHGEGKIGVMVEVGASSAAAATSAEAKTLASDVCLHIAAMNPMALSQDQMDATVVAKEKEILKQKNLESGKKAEMVDKIVEGQIRKFLAENCLLDQPFVKNPDLTIGAYAKELSKKAGGDLTIKRFTRFELGAGIEKKVVDFAAEVAAQTKTH